jgi:hypothetical protein
MTTLSRFSPSLPYAPLNTQHAQAQRLSLPTPKAHAQRQGLELINPEALQQVKDKMITQGEQFVKNEALAIRDRYDLSTQSAETLEQLTPSDTIVSKNLLNKYLGSINVWHLEPPQEELLRTLISRNREAKLDELSTLLKDRRKAEIIVKTRLDNDEIAAYPDYLVRLKYLHSMIEKLTNDVSPEEAQEVVLQKDLVLGRSDIRPDMLQEEIDGLLTAFKGKDLALSVQDSGSIDYPSFTVKLGPAERTRKRLIKQGLWDEAGSDQDNAVLLKERGYPELSYALSPQAKDARSRRNIDYVPKGYSPEHTRSEDYYETKERLYQPRRMFDQTFGNLRGLDIPKALKELETI